MLQQNFTPPDQELSKKETRKRMNAINSFVPRIKSAITSVTVTGSMASGQNYSVTEKSDIDIQMSVTRDSVMLLKETNLFAPTVLDIPVKAYLENLINQFSISIEINGITHECHFWDEEAMISAMEMGTQFTKRIRTTNASAAIDHGFAFDGSHNTFECPTEEINGLYISVLPSYRYINSKLFLSRPITNWLNTPYILFGNQLLEKHINTVWEKVVAKLVQVSTNTLNLSTHNVLNALPSKFKASSDAKAKILERTTLELDKLGVSYTI
jgi:predicted nucleotidyltransferase